MNIIKRQILLTTDEIYQYERFYKATWVGDFCIKTADGGWYNAPVAIFHTEKKHPIGSNYMAMFRSMNMGLSVADGISATEPFTGLELPNGEVIYSAYRHDCWCRRGWMVDGGRDYLKTSYSSHVSEPAKPVTLQIINASLEVIG